MRASPALLGALIVGCAISRVPDASVGDAGTIDAGPVDCRELRAELRVELDRIVSCARDEECGLELDPRCGCSSDRVARLDADRSAFDALAGRWRAACADTGARSVVLDRPCVCHDVVPGTYGCRDGMCVHTIEAPDCVYDGAELRVGDSIWGVDEINGCTCDPVGSGPPAVGCTLII